MPRKKTQCMIKYLMKKFGNNSRYPLLQIDAFIQRGLMAIFIVLGLKILNKQESLLSLWMLLLFIGLWQFFGNIAHMDRRDTANRKYYFLTAITYFISIALISQIAFLNDLYDNLIIAIPILLAIWYFIITEQEYHFEKRQQKKLIQ